VLATRISGNLGMLGENYPGYFEVGNSQELAGLMYRCEAERDFYRTLGSRGRALSARFTPEREIAAWQDLLDELL
jgi:glycosyltransferase involved in cell wall biosynthesis